MLTLPILLSGLLAVFGGPLVLVGLILRLCESSWGKPAGSMGSRRFLVAGGLLCAPAIAWLTLGLLASSR
jgi:hypothetical protein